MPISSKKVVKILEANGFQVLRQVGSHLSLRHADSRTTVVPLGQKDLGQGLLAAIKRQTGVKLR